MLGWLLAGIYAQPTLSENWVFKGGTCLKKCYFETYRFSEDLDFTLIDATQLRQAFCTRDSGMSQYGYTQTLASKFLLISCGSSSTKTRAARLLPLTYQLRADLHLPVPLLSETIPTQEARLYSPTPQNRAIVAVPRPNRIPCRYAVVAVGTLLYCRVRRGKVESQQRRRSRVPAYI